MSKLIQGTLLAYAETGTEGILWSLEEKGKPGYDGLYVLENGDKLTVYHPESLEVAWSGVVQLEYESCYRPYPLNPQYGQQAVLGYWVHGLQTGTEPEVWAQMFFAERPATLHPIKPR